MEQAALEPSREVTKEARLKGQSSNPKARGLDQKTSTTSSCFKTFIHSFIQQTTPEGLLYAGPHNDEQTNQS